MTTPMLRLLALLAALASPAAAQDLFSPAIVVNDRAVTGWEIDQRARMLTFFNTAGDTAALAREGLVEDRLKSQELDRVGLALGDEGLAAALEEFTGRAGFTVAEFEAVLGQNGIAPETLRDYVAINYAWRDYIRERFGEAVDVGDDEIDAALAREAVAGQGIEVLLSEIIIPAPPPQAAQAEATALAISRAGGLAAFEAAAREVSATASRDQGGRLDWAPISNYPASLQDLLLGLAPGEVTPPIPLEGAVALLQLRDVREVAAAAAEPEAIDHAVLRIPGGLSDAALAEARRVAATVDACDDLYGVAQGLPEDRLRRESLAPAAIAPDLALQLAGLDANEATWGLTADGGQTLLFVMLCARTYALPEGAADREAVAGVLRSERLEGYSAAIIADLRAAATIVGE